jgi:hypothetical protein
MTPLSDLPPRIKDANVVDKLDPCDKVSDVFPQQPPEDDVHILVQVLAGT